MIISCAVCGRPLGDPAHYQPGDLCTVCAAAAVSAAPEPETDTTADTAVESEVTGAGTTSEPTA